LTHEVISNTRVGPEFSAAIKTVVGTIGISTQCDSVETDKVTSYSDRKQLRTVSTERVGGAAGKIDGSADTVMCMDSVMQVEQVEVMSSEHRQCSTWEKGISKGIARMRPWRCSRRATSIVYSVISDMCIPPDILPAIVKAGCRSGMNKHRIPLVVADSVVVFIDPKVYEVYDVVRGVFECMTRGIIRVCMNMFFTPRVRNKHDLASHMG
jgi:hypothetical protein